MLSKKEHKIQLYVFNDDKSTNREKAQIKSTEHGNSSLSGS